MSNSKGQSKESVTLPEAHIHQILIGETISQEACSRSSAIQVISNSSHDFDKLKGFLPVSEDWHANLSVSFYGIK